MRKENSVLITLSVVVVLLASAFAGTIVYYNGAVDDRNSKIALMNTQIANLTSQTSNLKSQLANLTNQITNVNSKLTNLTSANLVTALGITEVSNTSSISRSYNRLYIEGSVTNTGTGTALNAGLHVVAYAADGTLEINMTVPLGNGGDIYGDFGADDATNSYVSSFDIVFTSLKLGSLVGGQTANVHLDIYHEGTVSYLDHNASMDKFSIT